MRVESGYLGSPAKLGESDEVQGTRNAGGEAYQPDGRSL